MRFGAERRKQFEMLIERAASEIASAGDPDANATESPESRAEQIGRGA